MYNIEHGKRRIRDTIVADTTWGRKEMGDMRGIGPWDLAVLIRELPAGGDEY